MVCSVTVAASIQKRVYAVNIYAHKPHPTAACPWHLAQVVVLGSDPEDSSSSFLFWPAHAFPASPPPPCQPRTFPSEALMPFQRSRKGASRTTEECPGSVLVASEDSKNPEALGAAHSPSLCELLEATFHFVMEPSAGSVFYPCLLC